MQYLSNNAAHPFRWDRSGEAPYPPLEDLLDEAGPCWNEVGWDVEACGPLPDHSDRDVPGDSDAGQTDSGSTLDVSAEADVTGEDSAQDPKRGASSSRGCAGCAMTGEGAPLHLFFSLFLGGVALFLRRRAEG